MKNITYLNLSANKSSLDKKEVVCPYKSIDTCAASFSSMFIDDYRKANYCCNEDYDDCPIFLSKILRRT